MIPISNFFGFKKNYVFVLILIDSITNAGGLRDEGQFELIVLNRVRNIN